MAQARLFLIVIIVWEIWLVFDSFVYRVYSFSSALERIVI